MSIPPVVHLSPFPPAGASETPQPGVPGVLARLVPAFAAAGVPHQTVIAARTRGPRRRERPAPTIEVVRAYRPGPAFHRVGRLLASAPARVVHAQHEVFLYGGPATAVQFPRALATARRAGRAVLVSVHGVPDLAAIDRGFVAANGSRMPPRAVRAALRRLVGAAAAAGDAVIVHDPVFAERLMDQYAIVPARVHVIPIPVPERRPEDRSAARAALGLTAPTALFFGFVTGYKGLPLLLEGWERYRRAGGRGELVVGGGRHPRLAGGAAYEREYAGLVARAARAGGVRWVGYIPERAVPSWFTAADLLTLPYRDALAASGPMAYALAYGMPVIGSDLLAGILPDPCGCFARDPAAVAVALADGLEGPGRERLAEASGRLGAERSLARVAGATADLYERLAR